MPTIHVTNWNDLVTAVAVNGDTVILDNDIDLINIPVTNQVRIGALTTLDGAGHTIKNLTSSIADCICCRTTDNCFVNNLNFYNVSYITDSDSKYFITSTNGYYNSIIFTNCNFQGIFTRFASVYSKFNKCIMSFTNSNNQMFNITVTLDTCYIDLGNCISNKPNILSCEKCTNTFIKGNVTLTNSPTSIINLTGAFDYNVVNVDVKSNSSVTIPFINSTTLSCLYNSDKLTNITITPVSNVYGLTDTQLKDSAYISQNTNFPIGI